MLQLAPNLSTAAALLYPVFMWELNSGQKLPPQIRKMNMFPSLYPQAGLFP